MNENIKVSFINWLTKIKKDNGSNKYTRHTINTYVNRLGRLTDNFFSTKGPQGLKELAENIDKPLLACCLCEALQEPVEMLKESDVQLLADVFYTNYVHDFDKRDDIEKSELDRFTKMVLVLWQKENGVKNQKVLKLFFDFLNESNWALKKEFYNNVLKKLNLIQKQGLIYLKYGYIEATQTTPSLIVGRAGQDYISILGLQNILECDKRTIQKLVKEEKISCCHHRKDLCNLSDINNLFAHRHPSNQNGMHLRVLDGISEEENIAAEAYHKLKKLMKALADLPQKTPDRRDIVKEMNRVLFYYQKDLGIKPNWWLDVESKRKMLGRTRKTISLKAKNGEILSIRLFRRKKRYFCG